MNELAKIQALHLKRELAQLFQLVVEAQKYVTEFGKEYGEFGERIPRIVEILDKADGYLDDAKAELEVLSETEPMA